MTPWSVLLFLCVAGSHAMVYDTIVVGLGSAGTTAASTLAQAGKKVLALEAMDRVGGRVNTVPFGDGLVELGAEWIHGTANSRVYETAIANNIDVVNQTLNFQILMSDGSPADTKLLSELMDFATEVIDDPPPVPEPLGQYITRRVKERINEKYPQIANDTDFIESFLFFMDLVIDNLEASNSWNDLSTFSDYEELKGHQYASWHRYGYKTFFELMLNTYNNGPGYPNLDIALNKEVSRITWPRQPAEDAVVSCSDGSVYRARSVIVTVSLGVLKERHAKLFCPELPQEKATLIDILSIGVVDKIVLLFDKVWWPSNVSFIGFLWDRKARINIHPKDKWITKIYGLTIPLANDNAITLWTSGNCAKLVETLPEDVVKTKSMEILRRFMGRNTNIPEPTAMLRSSWYKNPFTRGSYTYDNLLTPQYPNAREDLGKPLLDSAGNPRVLFAGEATNPQHYSTVHGASETGYREAMRLLNISSKI
ncbi:protein anon-37Cs isoform X2 [Manduca sexta]|uniref:protein anon-37Cs isoform X2 n=1 Tax=Manduca sexta TaxID=7130 RepID=UPI00188F3F18|nr:protein anon-37Cs isoform X2 [Manduca sexta]